MAEKAEERAQGACKKGEPWSLAGRGAKARDMGPCGFSQREGGGRGGAALLF